MGRTTSDLNESLMKKNFAEDLTDPTYFKETKTKVSIKVHPFRPILECHASQEQKRSLQPVKCLTKLNLSGKLRVNVLLVPKSRIHERQRRAPSAHLVAIVILSAVVMDLLNEPEEDHEIVYVLVDNQIIIDENATVEELSRDDVAKVASFNIKVFSDKK